MGPAGDVNESIAEFFAVPIIAKGSFSDPSALEQTYAMMRSFADI